MDGKKPKPALFLDRDGTLIHDPGYISSGKNLKLLYGAREALSRFRRRGYRIIVISNQSGIGRGYFREKELSAIHGRLDSKLKEAKPDAYYFCPHLPDDNCLCRKPNIQNLEKAMKEWNIKKEGSLMVGDRMSDLEVGKNFGLPSFLVLTGLGYETLGEIEKKGESIHAFAHLKELADYFLLKA